MSPKLRTRRADPRGTASAGGSGVLAGAAGSRAAPMSRLKPGERPLEVRFNRGRVVESRHRVHAVVAEASGELVGSWGDGGRVTVLRSVAKPFQALPLVADGAAQRFGLSGEEIALCCGSHNSEEVHMMAARSILAKAGVPAELLVCGAHPPLLAARRDELSAAGTPWTPLMCNCSGKHAGMLALAAFHGWPLQGYERADHPLQRRMGRELEHWTGAPPTEMLWEMDGCGVPTFAMPLVRLAHGTARLAVAARGEGPPRQIVRAMTRHPFMVAGTGRLCTRLMEEEGGRVFAKVGAEGVYVAGDLERGLGVALKVEDGAGRAAPPALMEVLDRAGILSSTAKRALKDFAEPVLRNTLGDEVGRVSVEETRCS